MSRFWTSPKRLYRLHRVCWGAYKRCWKGGRSPLVASSGVTEESPNTPQPIDRIKE